MPSPASSPTGTQALGGGILPQTIRDRIGGGGQVQPGAAEPGPLFVALTGPASQLGLLILRNPRMLALSCGWRE
jgi:hypothetical protein